MTPKEQAAMQQALEIIENHLGWGDGKTATALREALAEQAEQEPMTNLDMLECWMNPVQVKVVAEISAVRSEIYPALPMGTILYAAPVRTKDLTDDEICKANKTELPDCQDLVDFARAVIAADREKNNANNNT